MNDSASKPDLTQLRVQSRELLRSVQAGDASALARALRYFPAETDFKLSHAQLVLARENGFESWAKLKHALDVDAPEPVQTRLDEFFTAVERGDNDLATTLLAANPGLAGSWRRCDHGWESALHVAAHGGNLELVRALVEAGADVYPVRQGDYPPIFEAIYRRHDDVVAYLLEASAARDNGQPPTMGFGIDIVLATRVGWLDRVKMHVERDPFAVYRRGCIGESVLHWPAHNGFVEIVRYLLDHGAAIEADEIGLYGGKPLTWAAEHEPGTVRLLLERGADPNSRNVMKGDKEGFTPLHMTASQREQCIECAELLLTGGADPTLLDARGETPLRVAERKGHHRMAEFLRART
jgi:ankyrin repeat protein